MGFGGCVWGSPGASRCKFLCPPECQSLVGETDCHHQAHQEGPGAKPPTTEHWTTDHDQFSFTWPLSTLPEKSQQLFFVSMKKPKLSSFSTTLNHIKTAPSPLKKLSEASCQRIIDPQSLRRLVRAVPWRTVKSGRPGFKKKKKIKIIIVVTNNLSVPQAAKLLLLVMSYFHNILKLTVKASQEKRNNTKVNLEAKNSPGERNRFKPKCLLHSWTQANSP